MSNAISAQSTYLSVGSGASPQVWTEIPECRTIPGPAGTSDEIDVTHLRSTGGHREYLQSFKDTDDLSLECNYIPANAVQAQLRNDFNSGTIREYQKTYPDGSTESFMAYVKSASSPAAVGDALMFNVTLRVTGFVTFHSS